MKDTYFDAIKTRIIMSCGYVNDCADGKDLNRNHVNYGCAITWASVLRDMGHDVDVPVWEDVGYLRIPKLKIDGEVIVEYPNGK